MTNSFTCAIMTAMKKVVLLGMLMLSLGVAWGADPEPAAETAARPARLANGAVIEGSITGVSAEGITVQTLKGPITYPWKYLSAATLFRFRDNPAEPAKESGK